MSFLDDLFGASAKREDLAQAAAEASEMRDAALSRFTGTTHEGIQQATSPLRPAQESGLAALMRFAAGIGAQGPEAQRSFNEAFIASPGTEAELEAANRNIMRNQAIGGNTGATIEALARQGLLTRRSGVESNLANLLRLATMGQTAGRDIAGITERGFGRIGEAEFGTGQQEAAQILGLGQARADTRGSGLAQTIEALKAAAQIAAAIPTGGASLAIPTGTATGAPGAGVGGNAFGSATLNRIPGRIGFNASGTSGFGVG